MTTMRLLAFGCLATIILLGAGCATGPTKLEATYGTSFYTAKQNQMFKPDAAKNLDPVYGFDGTAASNTIERYRESFAKPPPPPQFVISIGQR